MMKLFKIFLLAILGMSLMNSYSFAQIQITMIPGTTVVDTISWPYGQNYFYDSGGPNNPYTSSENSIVTVCPTSTPAPLPNNVRYVWTVFSEFDLEPNIDWLYIYNGQDTTASLIGSYTGSNLPAVYSSDQSGCLTFYFESNASINYSGWVAEMGYDSTEAGLAQSELDGINISPNPTKGEIDVELGSMYNKVSLILYDISGRILQENEFKNISTTNLLIDQPPGPYTLEIIADTKRAVVRIVKQ